MMCRAMTDINTLKFWVNAGDDFEGLRLPNTTLRYATLLFFQMAASAGMGCPISLPKF